MYAYVHHNLSGIPVRSSLSGGLQKSTIFQVYTHLEMPTIFHVYTHLKMLVACACMYVCTGSYCQTTPTGITLWSWV